MHEAACCEAVLQAEAAAVELYDFKHEYNFNLLL